VITTLLLVGGFALITAYAIMSLSRVSREAGKEEANAEDAEEALESRRKFDEEASRPIARGADLIRRMRDWSNL